MSASSCLLNVLEKCLKGKLMGKGSSEGAQNPRNCPVDAGAPGHPRSRRPCMKYR
jgi:hypothetical protein